MERELFDEMYQVESYHWWFVARRKIIKSVIAKLNLENNARIFDAGCGNGDNLSLLANYGQVTAMERDDNALAYAKNRGIGKIYQGELPNTVPDEIDNNFDLIVMLDVLEHIDDDNMSLQVLHEHVKDNGVLLITLPAYHC
jgi:2-polyprenyl-3-methyl-5-hydroxy-6-metoxy-1,4-benzoquinol methylase